MIAMSIESLPDRPRIAVVGPGAIGSYYGGRLVQHGHDVHFLMRSDYEAIRGAGLRVESVAGDFRLQAEEIQAYNDVAAMPKADLVLVTLKTTANHRFKELITPLLHESTIILTLQNGLGNEELLAELFGGDRVLGGLAFVCINRLSPGHIRHSDHGLIKIGGYQRQSTVLLEQIAGMFQESGVACQVLENLAVGRWEKLVWNVPFNGLGAALDLATDELLASDAGIQLVRELMREVVDVAQLAGVRLGEELIEKNIQKTRTMGSYRSSMQIDRRLGRPMEIDSIIGAPLRVAQKMGMDADKMACIYRYLVVVQESQTI